MLNKVIICGGGIGGLSLANSLRRVGIEYVLVEKAPRFGDVGFGLTLGFNALHALKKIDPLLEELVVDKAVKGTGFAIRNEQMEWVGKPGALDWKEEWVTERDERRYGPMRFLPISRSALQHSLLEGLEYEEESGKCLGGELMAGTTMNHWEENEKGVKVILDNGKEIEGDVLVGADGGASRLREEIHSRYSSVLGPSPPVTYTNVSLWGGNATGMDDFLEEKNQQDVFMWNIKDDGNMFLVLPMGKNKTYWSIGLRFPPDSPPFPTSTTPNSPIPSTTTEIRKWLTETIAPSFPPPLQIQKYIDNTDFSASVSSESGFYRWDICELGERTGKEGDKRWGEGRVTLLGDAAHMIAPWAGQGAGISIEDAHCFGVLAAEMKRGESVEGVLREYEKVRGERAVMIRQEARNNEKVWLARTPLARAARKFVFSYMPNLAPVMKFFVRRLLDYDYPKTPLSELSKKK